MNDFVDISGTELYIGDKVAVQYQQLFRIGQVLGFTSKKVIVGFAFSIEETPLEEVKLDPWRLAKVVNQDIGLRDYFDQNKWYERRKIKSTPTNFFDE